MKEKQDPESEKPELTYLEAVDSQFLRHHYALPNEQSWEIQRVSEKHSETKLRWFGELGEIVLKTHAEA
jgi:hypothetical protein